MRILALIAEYNPFHNGHLYHLKESKKITGASHTIALMSGNFLQRGEPALVDKWNRAKMAILNGVDLVIELPTIFACATAELFAWGGVKLLDDLGVVNSLVFGSEAGDLSSLNMLAKILLESPQSFESKLKSFLSQGMPFPAARSKAMKHYCITHLGYHTDIHKMMSSPNNILAIEYLKALNKLDSPINPKTITRVNATYHSKEIKNKIASATAIREKLRKTPLSLTEIKNVVPKPTYESLSLAYSRGLAPVFEEDFSQAILASIRRMDSKDLVRYFDVKEGLENRISKSGHNSNDLSSLYGSIKSKRYTLTRIQRICIHILLNLDKDIIKKYKTLGPRYIRVLGLNNKGREILRLCKQKSKLPIISKIPRNIPWDSTIEEMLQVDIKASSIYGLALGDSNYASKIMDFYEKPYYKNS